MAEKNLSPRQKMIGMMYLVLTALLALNVAKEVLDAFVLVDRSLGKTTDNFVTKNEGIYEELDRQAARIERAKPFREKAQAVKKAAHELVRFIEDLKKEIVMKADGPDYSMDAIRSQDNLDIPSEVMIFEKKGSRLKERLADYKSFLASMVSPKNTALQEALEDNLATPAPSPHPDKGSQSWEQEHFENLPLIAVITMLSKIQNDIRNAEFDVINDLHANIDGETIPFNKVAGTVIAPTNYVLRGDSFRADIFLAAFDTTQSPVIYIGDYDTLSPGNYTMKAGYDSIPVRGGMGRYAVPAQAEGLHSYGGLIQLQTREGKRLFPFRSDYQVAIPTAVVSADKMNVLYIGLDNPISISVPGIPADRIRPQISNGSLTRSSNGSYIARVRSGNQARITVMADMGDGQFKNMGSMDYRVKRVPKPIAKVNGVSSGKIRKNDLVVYPGVVAEMEGFVFEGVRWNVTQYEVFVLGKGGRSLEKKDGYTFTEIMKRTFRGLQRGDKVLIENIKATGPGGARMLLSPIVLEITT